MPRQELDQQMPRRPTDLLHFCFIGLVLVTTRYLAVIAFFFSLDYSFLFFTFSLNSFFWPELSNNLSPESIQCSTSRSEAAGRNTEGGELLSGAATSSGPWRHSLQGNFILYIDGMLLGAAAQSGQEITIIIIIDNRNSPLLAKSTNSTD